MEPLSSINLFGVHITTSSKDKILKYVSDALKKEGFKISIVTPNPEIIMYARSHDKFRNLINEASIALPDGVGVCVASFLCRKGRIQRITGTDFMEDLVSYVSKEHNMQGKDKKNPIKLGFFGGMPGVAEKAANCLQKKYSRTEVVYASDTWEYKKIQGLKIDILFVALGFPKQEIWISENMDKIPAKIVMGVGGAFDFISGDIPRAPKFIRQIGLEWLYRLMVQPWRWKRQLALIRFSLLTFREAFHI